MTTEIEKCYHANANSYHDLKAEAEKQVVRWRHSKGELWTHDPFVKLTTDEVDDSKDAKHSYGYDSKGRVVCIRYYADFPDYSHRAVPGHHLDPPIIRRELRVEYFIRHGADRMEVFRFITDYSWKASELQKHTLQWLAWLWMKNDMLQEEVKFEEDRDWYSHTRYLWSEDKVQGWQQLNGEGRITMEYIKDENGVTQHYRIKKDGSRILLGQPLPKGLTVKKLVETIRTRLLNAIPATVKAAKIKAPIYCVALGYYGDGNDALPPSLGIGLESERSEWLKTEGRDAKYKIWNPAEFRHFQTNRTQLDDPKLDEACEWLNSELRNRNSTAPARRLIVEVAAELNKLDWSKFAKVTPDFVVFATDFELGDLNKNLKKILPAKKLAALKAAKLI